MIDLNTSRGIVLFVFGIVIMAIFVERSIKRT